MTPTQDHIDYIRAILLTKAVYSDELLSTCSERLLTACEQFDPSRGVKFSSYLYRVVMNEIAKHFRAVAANREMPVGNDYFDPIAIAEDADDVDELVSAYDMISALPIKFQSVARCIWLDGLTPTLTAAKLGLKFRTVCYRRDCCLTFLRSYYDRDRR